MRERWSDPGDHGSCAARVGQRRGDECLHSGTTQVPGLGQERTPCPVAGSRRSARRGSVCNWRSAALARFAAAASVPMGVVCIRYVWVRMLLRLMSMPVAVLANGHGLMQVIVVPVVVAVRVFVLQRLVFVLVLV